MFMPRLALVALTLSATALFFPAASIYFNNVQDYRLGFTELLLPALLLVLLAAGLLMALGHLLPTRWRQRGLVLMTMVSIAFWLQANLLVWNYGLLDGGDIPWARHHARGALEVLIWLALLVVGWRHARQLAPRATTIAGAVLGVQLLGLGLTAWQSPPPPTHHRFSVDTQQQFALSSQQNLIIIVLDAFQSDVFQQILDERPAFHQVFDGFTYFRNALAGYAKTYPSIPLMLSGQWYQNDEPIERFMARAYLRGSLPQQLRAADWDVGLYPHIMRTFYFDSALANNFVDQVDRNERFAAAAQFVDVGLFRALPHFVKPWWLNDYAWRLQGLLPPATLSVGADDPAADAATTTQRSQQTHSALRWLEDMQTGSRVSADNPAMRFYHLFVPHAPFLLNETLEMELLPSNREGFRRHSEAALVLMQQYLAQLQALGVYDQSTIAIVSEHGGGEYNAGVETERLGTAVQGNPNLSTEYHASGLPLVLIKPATVRGALATNDAPVSLGDLAHTLATIVGLQGHGLPGEDMFQIASDAQRSRYFLGYEFDGFDVQYLPDMLEFRVEGHSWQPASWQLTGNILRSAGEARPGTSASASPLQVGNRVYFNERGNGLRLLDQGWSTPEAEGSWSRTTEASINLPLANPIREDLALHLQLRPFLSATAETNISSQHVTLLINGQSAANWQVSEAGSYSVVVDAGQHGGSETLQLQLLLPDATRPAQLLQSEDVRQLGVMLQQLSLELPHYYTLGTTLDFGPDGNAEPYLAEGWSVGEPGFRWTDGMVASLLLPLDGRTQDELLLHFSARPFTVDGQLAEQQLTLRVNGENLAQWSLQQSEQLTLPIPAALVATQRSLHIEFVLPDAASPEVLGVSQDTRQLGIALQELRLEHSD